MRLIIGVIGILLLSSVLLIRFYNKRKKKNLLARGASPSSSQTSPILPRTRRQRFFNSSSSNSNANTKRGKRFKIIGASVAIALILLWIVLSFASTNSDPKNIGAPELRAEEGETTPPEKIQVAQVTMKLDPPPSKVENPLIFEITPELPENTSTTGSNPPETPLAETSLDLSPVPEEDSPIKDSAKELAPIISRMEPLGRYLDPQNPVPRALPITPPNKEKEKVDTKLKLTTPPPKAKTETKPRVSVNSRERRYTVIVASFTKEENANNLKEQLEKDGIPSEVIPVTNNGKPWWRVSSGVFEDKASAEIYLRELRKKKGVDSPYVKAL
jgi:cell division septation protein DedD